MNAPPSVVEKKKPQRQTKRGYINFFETTIKKPQWALSNRFKFRAPKPRSRRVQKQNLKRKREPAPESGE